MVLKLNVVRPSESRIILIVHALPERYGVLVWVRHNVAANEVMDSPVRIHGADEEVVGQASDTPRTVRHRKVLGCSSMAGAVLLHGDGATLNKEGSIPGKCHVKSARHGTTP